MHEKTLLYAALGVTAVAAAFGVYKAKDQGPNPEIAPIPLSDSSSKGITNAEVPIRLTASDGTGLKLVALKAEAAVEDPLALTELHLTFENPEPRVLEGTFRITLPQGASLSRFAMKVGETWQEGEVVEKQQARAAYEDFLHRKQDPALMEQGAGNEFSARVFPIPARGTKEIIVTYSEAVEISQPYVLPLRGLPQLGSLDVSVHVTGKTASANGGKTDATYAIHQTKFTPASDFVVESKQLPRSPGLRAGRLAITRVIPFAQSRPEPVGSAVVLVDTSASRGLGIRDQAKAVRDMLAKLPSDTTVTVACFDQEVVPLYEGKASGFGEKEISTIVARGALGASDFENAIGWAGAEAKKKKASRIVFVTDGVATAGETDAQKLKLTVEALRDAGVTRMDAIATGGIRDDGFLRTVVRGVLDRDGVVLDGKLGADAIARRLGEATSSGVAVNVEGARWSYPEKLDGLQAGDEVLVYAELEDDGQPVKISVGGQPFNPDLRTIERPLVERAWAQAKIQSLVEQPKDNAAATKTEIIALSTRHRVLSPYTALLVLENDWDYRRFNIDRNAKVDILTVEDGKVAVTESGRVREDENKKRFALEKSKAKGGGGAEAKAESAPVAAAEP
ncbi:MAG: VWA domain-containing protein, partial [Labilithrix sp.]|nr:VWA domain-containing protein [Labilithrix sp.]